MIGNAVPVNFGKFVALAIKDYMEDIPLIGIINKLGREGGTYAQRDIAFKFASWVSVEFELYLIKEFQRLKEEEQKQLGWSAKRELSKINYRIHTDAIHCGRFQGRSSDGWRFD